MLLHQRVPPRPLHGHILSAQPNPEGTKVKILKDQHGHEHVLYHDCFHCLPKELAPEFADEDDEKYAKSSGEENFEDTSDDNHDDGSTYEDGAISSEDNED